MITVDFTNSTPMTLNGLVTQGTFSVGSEVLTTFTNPISSPSNCPSGCGCENCVFVYPVFAEPVYTNELHNDKTHFYGRSFVITGADVDWFLEKDGVELFQITDSTYGTLINCGGYASDSRLSTLYIDWRSVLNSQGEGCYRIRYEIQVGGTVSFYSEKYHLQKWYENYAEGTVRFKWKQNGKILDKFVDFTGLNFEQMVRLPGRFGMNKPTIEIDEIEQSNHSFIQIRDKVINEWGFESELLSEHALKLLMYDIALANSIEVTDYNFFDTWTIVNKKVKVTSIEEPLYLQFNKCASLIMRFADITRATIKRNFY